MLIQLEEDEIETILEIVKILAGLKDNPVALISFLAFSALALAAWAIYALIVTVSRQKGEKQS